jgi:hypothetical protein
MTAKRLARFCLAPMLAMILAAAGCATKDTVRVIDSTTRLPVFGARVVPVYPSIGGPGYVTDERGVATIGGFGLPRGGDGIQISASGYRTNYVSTYPDIGRRIGPDDHLIEVSLEPLPKP